MTGQQTNDNAPSNFEGEKTAIIKINKSDKKSDSVGGFIGGILISFFIIFSLFRLTVIGQFLDDVLMTLLFGWFKYLAYAILIVLAIALFFSLHIKIKKRVLFLFIFLVLILCWLATNIMMMVQYFNNDLIAFDSNIFNIVFINYFENWKQSSVFNGITSFTSFNGEWFNPLAGGGLIGALIASIFSYTSIFGSLIFNIIAFILLLSSALTGSIFGFFLNKKRNKNKKLQIVKVGFEKKAFKNKNKKNALVEEEFFLNSRQVIHDVEESEVTMQLNSESAMDREQSLIDDLLQDNEPRKELFNQNKVHFEKKENVSLNKNGYILPQNRGVQDTKDILDNQTVYDKSGYILPRNQLSGKKTNSKRSEFATEVNITPFGKLPSYKQNESVKSVEEKVNNVNFEENVTLAQNRGFARFETGSSDLIQKKNTQDFNSKSEDNIYKKSSFDKSKELPSGQNTQSSFRNNSYNNNYRNNGFSDNEKSQTINIHKNTIEKAQQKQIVNDNYRLPNLGLLKNNEVNLESKQANEHAAREKALKINQVFDEFNVNAKVDNVNIGPTVTKFEVSMAPGTKISKITSLNDNLKYALATQNVRIEAPVQGKSAVGIEVPNAESNKVSLKELLERIPIEKQDQKLLVGIGRSVNGEIIFVELEKMPHLLIAGSTGSGKSVSINTILCSLLFRSKPHEVKLLLIDPKHVELAVYNELPHLIGPVITDTKLANTALKRIILEMERRYALLSQNSVRNVKDYNKKVSKEFKLPYIVVVIDELADLMMTAGKEIEDSIMRITQLARAAGIHMIIATQRPSTDVITGVIKTNIPSRIAFSVTSNIDSRTILDQGGAEKLIGYGDMLYSPAGQGIPTRAQGAYISDEEIESIVNFCKKEQPHSYEHDFLNLNEENDHNGNPRDGGGFDDPLIDEIQEFIISSQKASTSLLQRKFSIGYNRASRIIDYLEEEKIIGPQNGSKPREVFIKNVDVSMQNSFNDYDDDIEYF